MNLNYLPFKVVHFVLDYLRLIVAEDTAAALELLIQVLHSYSAETCNWADSVQRKAALLGLIGVGTSDDLRVDKSNNR